MNKTDKNLDNKDENLEEKAKKNKIDKELSLDDLESVTGGSLRNTHKTKTSDISSNTKGKV